MCGIAFCMYLCNTSNEQLKRRGPDHCGSSVSTFNHHSVSFYCYLLHIRGSKLCRQPLTDDKSNLLLFCGEMYQYEDEEFSDTNELLRLFRKKGVLESLREIKGEWAFIYLEHDNNCLWFARDLFGRRSLIMQHSGTIESLSLVSTSGLQQSGFELPCEGVFCLRLTPDSKELLFYPYKQNFVIDASPFSDSWRKIQTLPEIDLRIEDSVEMVNYESNAILTFPVICNEENCKCDIFKQIPEQLFEQVQDQLLHFLRDSIRSRVLLMRNEIECGVLFSGGLDSTVLAALMHEFYDEAREIELVNVAFEVKTGGFETPDRKSSKIALKELIDLAPERKWSLKLVNVTKEELQRAREQFIAQVLYPRQSVLDDSIGCSLWFAARGASCTVLLSGIGADEQLGGYSRHRSAFERGGWNLMEKEMNMDLDRIGARNMGRDDRVVADHGKELRMPFLDEDLVSFLRGLPPWMKTNPFMSREWGDKYLLRKVAQKLGLKEVAGFPKRAIQFGSRIAKMESKGEKGSDVCARLK